VRLPNHSSTEPGDNVGVLIPWTPPDAWEGVTNEKIHDFLSRVDEKAASDEPFSPHPNATTRWIGNLVMEVFGKDEGPAKTLIKTWIDNDVLEVFEGEYQRKACKAIKRGSTAPGSHYE
jgi:hypothetical protein